MQMLPGFTAPAHFRAICQAHERVKYLLGSRRLHLNVGVLDEHGDLVMRGSVDGLYQAQQLAVAMRELGYEERLLGPIETMAGCDLLFVPPQIAQGDEDSMSGLQVTESFLPPDAADSDLSPLHA